MKKLFILLLVIIYSNSSFSQAFGLDLGVGLKTGLNFNKVVGEGIKDAYKTDPHIGAFVYLNRHRIGLQIETVWTQNVMTTDSTFYGLYKQYYNRIYDSLTVGSFKFNTISIPILLNLKFSQKVWFQFGPQYNGTVSMVDKDKLLKSGTDIIKKNNYNFISGIWVQFGGKAPVLRVNAGARLIMGLHNINVLSNYEVWRNQMIQLHIGISY